MSDVMERLRSLADLFEAADAPRHLVLHVRAGADEIERLRAGGCARDQGTTQYCAEAAQKDAEIASLLNTLADARTENMRLRAALESTEAWLERWAVHVGSCEGGHRCACGLTAVQYEGSAALAHPAPGGGGEYK